MSCKIFSSVLPDFLTPQFVVEQESHGTTEDCIAKERKFCFSLMVEVHVSENHLSICRKKFIPKFNLNLSCSELHYQTTESMLCISEIG